MGNIEEIRQLKEQNENLKDFIMWLFNDSGLIGYDYKEVRKEFEQQENT